MDYFRRVYTENPDHKDALCNLIRDNITEGLMNDQGVDALRTTEYLHKEFPDHPELQHALKYITGAGLLLANHAFSGNKTKYHTDMYDNLITAGKARTMGGSLGFKRENFKLTHCWGNLFNKGMGIMEHNHYPLTISFSHYINIPSGSSFMILNGNTVEIEEGDIIYFPSYMTHSVPENNSEDRIALIGNILYTLDE